jgi:hypothetical protein
MVGDGLMAESLSAMNGMIPSWGWTKQCVKNGITPGGQIKGRTHKAQAIP